MNQNRKLVIVPFLVIGLVAGSFLGSSLYVERRTAELSRGARDIIEAAAPRLARLTDMRIEIHRIVTYGQSDGRGASPEARARIVEEAEANFERAFAGYARAPELRGLEPDQRGARRDRCLRSGRRPSPRSRAERRAAPGCRARRRSRRSRTRASGRRG